MKTRTIDNDLNPVWNEYFEAVVDQADGQKLRIELFDEDQGQDEELGRLSLDLSMIRSRGSLDRWFPLEGCKHGDLHIKATWMSLSTDLKYLDMRDAYEWLQADKPIHPALVMIFVDSVSELPVSSHFEAAQDRFSIPNQSWSRHRMSKSLWEKNLNELRSRSDLNLHNTL